MGISKNKVVVISIIDGLKESKYQDSDLINAMVSHHKKIVNSHLEEFNGEFKKYSENGITAIFDNSEDAVNFSVTIQQEFLKFPKIPVKIGIHKGPIAIENDEINGVTLETAERIAYSSQPGSVILSAEVNKLIEDSTNLESEFIDIFEWEENVPDVRMFAVREKRLVVPDPSEIDAEVKPLSSVDKKGKSSFIHIIISIGILVAASAIFAYLNVLATDPVIDDFSIAVLPFENLGTNEESKLIGDAVAKDIRSNLTLLEKLYVISDYSSSKYQSQEKPIKEIAQILGVAFILKGSTHKFGENIRVTAELVDVISDKSVWKKSFNQDFSEIMNIESQISKDVVDALRLKLSFDDMQNVVGISTGSIEAYQLFIKGRSEADKRSAIGNKNSIDFYSQAIRIDTSYAESYVELARSNINKVYYSNSKPKDIEKLANLYLDKAESINDQLGSIYSVRGYLYNQLNNQDLARSNLERAVELAPNDIFTRIQLAEYYNKTNQIKKQLLQNKLAYQLDPLNYLTANAYVSALILNKDFDEAEKLLKNINELLDEVDPVEMNRQYVNLYLSKKDYENVILPLIRLSDIDSTHLGALGYSYSKLGDTLKALAVIDSLKLKSNFTYQNYNIAKIYAGLGIKDSIYKYLDTTGLKIRVQKDSTYGYFDLIKDEKKFKRLIAPKPIS